MGILLKIFLTLALGAVAMNTSAENVDIQVMDPWVRAAPPNVKVLAAYLEIKNNGEKPQTIIGVSSPAFNQAEAHRSVMHGNMAHMEQQKELTIPPHASLKFEPGGLHLMLMDARKQLHVGDPVPLILTFRNGKDVTVTATVRSDQVKDTGNHEHMDHPGHKTHDH